MPENHCAPTRRAMRLGIAGPVGTGKSSLIMMICRELAHDIAIGVVTNDIYTDEDARMIRAAGVLDPARVLAVETGACPHTAIRDDITANAMACERLEAQHGPLDVILVESGGDNLTATFSPALVDVQIFLIDVAGGGDVARKGGPGIERADLLVVNKTDLGPHVGVDVPMMYADALAARQGGPVIALSRNDFRAVAELRGWVLDQHAAYIQGRLEPADPGPMAPHSHGPGEPEHAHAGGRPGHTH